MSGVKCRKWTLKKHFQGLPKREDMELVEEELPALEEGEFLCEAVWLSVDPYMRPFSAQLPLGSSMMGEQIAKVIQSKNSKYCVGDLVNAMFGWTTHSICDDTKAGEVRLFKVDLSVPSDKLSYALGALGMPGATAYLGFLKICQPKEGETLVVNAAAGAVGSLVGQIAKIKGCRVVGFAGSDAKVEYMKSLGFDAAYNYKTMSSLKDALSEGCPKGIDLFFDNVGGEFHSTVVKSMNQFGRVACCGAISEYNLPEGQPLVPSLAFSLISKQLKVEGFMVYNWFQEFGSAFKEMRGWIDQEKLCARETVTIGFENMFDAFLGLFKGENFGKAVVKA